MVLCSYFLLLHSILNIIVLRSIKGLRLLILNDTRIRFAWWLTGRQHLALQR